MRWSVIRTGAAKRSRNAKEVLKPEGTLLAWEAQFKLQKRADIDMTLESFYELYKEDIKPRLKENTWITKESIIEGKILPYLGKRKLSEITAKDIVDWQNAVMQLPGTAESHFSDLHEVDPCTALCHV